MGGQPAVAFAFLLLFALGAGCSSGSQGLSDSNGLSTATSMCGDPRLPPIHTPVFDAPTLLHAETEYPFEEPLVATASDGTVYVAAPILEKTLLRSDDGGRTYTTLPAAGLRGGDDAALATDGDAVWWAGLEPGSPMTIVLQRSDDRGASFRDVANFTGELHRPWVAAKDGTLLLAWVDRAGDRPDMVVTARSLDGGASWTAPHQLSEGFGLPGNVVASRTVGTFFVPFSDRLGDVAVNKVAVTRDAGATWTVHVATPDPGILPSLAEDSAGTLYMAYDFAGLAVAGASLPAGAAQPFTGTYLTVSGDGGTTWSTPARLSPADSHGILPALVAGQAGRIAVAYYASGPSISRFAPSQWWTVLAASDDGGATFHSARTTEEPAHIGALCNQCGPRGSPTQDRSRLDHLGLGWTQEGIVVAWLKDSDDPIAEAQQGTVLLRPIDVMASRADVRLG